LSPDPSLNAVERAGLGRNLLAALLLLAGMLLAWRVTRPR